MPKPKKRKTSIWASPKLAEVQRLVPEHVRGEPGQFRARPRRTWPQYKARWFEHMTAVPARREGELRVSPASRRTFGRRLTKQDIKRIEWERKPWTDDEIVSQQLWHFVESGKIKKLPATAGGRRRTLRALLGQMSPEIEAEFRFHMLEAQRRLINEIREGYRKMGMPLDAKKEHELSQYTNEQLEGIRAVLEGTKEAPGILRPPEKLDVIFDIRVLMRQLRMQVPDANYMNQLGLKKLLEQREELQQKLRFKTGREMNRVNERLERLGDAVNERLKDKRLAAGIAPEIIYHVVEAEKAGMARDLRKARDTGESMRRLDKLREEHVVEKARLVAELAMTEEKLYGPVGLGLIRRWSATDAESLREQIEAEKEELAKKAELDAAREKTAREAREAEETKERFEKAAEPTELQKQVNALKSLKPLELTEQDQHHFAYLRIADLRRRLGMPKLTDAEMSGIMGKSANELLAIEEELKKEADKLPKPEAPVAAPRPRVDIRTLTPGKIDAMTERELIEAAEDADIKISGKTPYEVRDELIGAWKKTRLKGKHK